MVPSAERFIYNIWQMFFWTAYLFFYQLLITLCFNFVMVGWSTSFFLHHVWHMCVNKIIEILRNAWFKIFPWNVIALGLLDNNFSKLLFLMNLKLPVMLVINVYKIRAFTVAWQERKPLRSRMWTNLIKLNFSESIGY